MAISLMRIDQLRKPDTHDDAYSAATISGIESAAISFDETTNALLSQLKRILKGDAAGDWKDNPAILGPSSSDASLTALAARAKLEDKLVLFWRLHLTDNTVPATQNYVTLAGAGTFPDVVVAIAALQRGAVVAQLGGAVGSFSLTEQAGTNALKPKNLVAVLDGSTGDDIMSSGRRIWGLLQVGSTAVDGVAFATSGAQLGQISFVRSNATFDDLEACPVADIEGRSIVYAYSHRNDLFAFSEDAYRGDVAEADPTAGTLVSLDSAYDGGNFMTVDASDVDIRLSDTRAWVFRKGVGGVILFRVRRDDAGTDTVEVAADVDLLDVNAANSDFAQGISVDTTDQEIKIGKLAVGVIDSTTIETRATTGDNTMYAADDAMFRTVRQTTAIPLDDATVGAISALTGGPHASIAAAIKYAIERGGVDMVFTAYVAAGIFGQDVNIPGASVDLSVYSLDANTPGTVSAFVFLNGRLLYGGNGTTNNDVYAGTTPASGDIKVDFPGGIRVGDVFLTIALKSGPTP